MCSLFTPGRKLRQPRQQTTPSQPGPFVLLLLLLLLLRELRDCGSGRPPGTGLALGPEIEHFYFDRLIQNEFRAYSIYLYNIISYGVKSALALV